MEEVKKDGKKIRGETEDMQINGENGRREAEKDDRMKKEKKRRRKW